MKIVFCRKNFQIILTFEKSKYKNRKREQFRKFRQYVEEFICIFKIAYLYKPYYNRRVKIRIGGVKHGNKRNDNW